MRGYSASLSYVTPTAPVHKHPPAPLPAPDNAVAPPAPRAAVRPGRAVKVAVIDTGITDQGRTDGLLADIARTPQNIDPLTSFPTSGPDKYLDFDAGHGTFVAGIIDQVAPHAEISVYRAIDPSSPETKIGGCAISACLT